MRLLQAAAENLRMFGVLLVTVAVAFIAFGLGIGLTLSTTGVLASHDDPDTIHACVNPLSSVARIVDDPAECARYEELVEWQGAAGSAALEARVSALEDQVPDCLSTVGVDAVFSDCNVFVQNGEGSTATTDGTGNLIIGYNEASAFGDSRTGSHNLVIGQEHSYTSFGGFVAGFNNQVTAPNASVSGGLNNTASGEASSVSGGGSNTASGEQSSVSGGEAGSAIGVQSSVTGGDDNRATGHSSTVSGGINGTASGPNSSVSGGSGNEATGRSSSVSGGQHNIASGESSSVSGGLARTASGPHDWAAGGLAEDF